MHHPDDGTVTFIQIVETHAVDGDKTILEGIFETHMPNE